MIIIRPLAKWDQSPVVPRSSRFKAAWGRTLDELQNEADQLTDSQWQTEIVIELDVTESDITVHDRLNARARPATSRVAVSFESLHGPLRYECGTFDEWRDNVRGVTLGLRALRAVARYGIGSRGEQYTGWKALGTGIALGPSSMTEREALQLLGAEGGLLYGPGTTAVTDDDVTVAYRRAAKRHHPDAGGDAEMFKRLGDARALLQGATP